jgi:kynurenine formamidase
MRFDVLNVLSYIITNVVLLCAGESKDIKNKENSVESYQCQKVAKVLRLSGAFDQQSHCIALCSESWPHTPGWKLRAAFGSRRIGGFWLSSFPP